MSLGVCVQAFVTMLCLALLASFNGHTLLHTVDSLLSLCYVILATSDYTLKGKTAVC